MKKLTKASVKLTATLVGVITAGLFATNVSAATPATHEVQSGDTLWDIANTYETTVEAITEANGLDSTLIFPGDELTVDEEASDIVAQEAEALAQGCEPGYAMAEDYSCVPNDFWAQEDADATEAPGTNVGDGQTYTYEVTSIEGDEIHGVPLTKASEGNRGIFLYADEVPFEVSVGDALAIVWGEHEDEFASIERGDGQ